MKGGGKLVRQYRECYEKHRKIKRSEIPPGQKGRKRVEREELIRWSEPKQVLLLLDKSREELKEMLGDEFAAMKNYAQNNPHHCYNLLEHTVRTVGEMDCGNISDEDAVQLRVAALLHDIGKPVVAFQKNGKTVFIIMEKSPGKLQKKTAGIRY